MVLFQYLLVPLMFVCSAHSQFILDEPPYKDVDFEQLISNKCRQNSANATVDGKMILSSFSEFFFCQIKQVENLPPYHWNDSCTVFRSGAYKKCFLPLLNSISECLSKEESYFIDYLKATYQPFFTNLCVVDYNKIEAEYIFLFSQPKRERDSDFIEKLLRKCFPNLHISKNVLGGQLTLTEREFRSDLTELQQCSENFIAANEYKKVTVEAFEFFFHPFFEWNNVI